jgi:hypothetical protein
VQRLIGRSMIGNFLTRPDFLSYELAGLPSRVVSAWRGRGVPVVAWPVRSLADELEARKYADNIIFSDFRPEKLMRRNAPCCERCAASRYRHQGGDPRPGDL